jgi:hypothetical protein
LVQPLLRRHFGVVRLRYVLAEFDKVLIGLAVVIQRDFLGGLVRLDGIGARADHVLVFVGGTFREQGHLSPAQSTSGHRGPSCPGQAVWQGGTPPNICYTVAIGHIWNAGPVSFQALPPRAGQMTLVDVARVVAEKDGLVPQGGFVIEEGADVASDGGDGQDDASKGFDDSQDGASPDSSDADNIPTSC